MYHKKEIIISNNYSKETNKCTIAKTSVEANCGNLYIQGTQYGLYFVDDKKLKLR